VVWSLYTGTLYVFFQLLKWITSLIATRTSAASLTSGTSIADGSVHGIEKAAEESALDLSPEIDGRSLIWTLKSLNEDDQLERFFAAIPGFCNSKWSQILWAF
jgi:hypothetical protein